MTKAEMNKKVSEVTGLSQKDVDAVVSAYVGVVIEDDGMTEAEFKETMLGMNEELNKLNQEAKQLETEISNNLKELFGEQNGK